jgi:Ni/Co efflux regulator RcnB
MCKFGYGAGRYTCCRPIKPPHGYERIIIDGKVLLVEIATHVIHDILTDVILH